MKRLLMIAYHFPPLAGSSGIQRTLRFARHLPTFGWEPLVLSAHPRAFPSVSEDQMGEVPSDMVVERAFALDSARHLSVMGRYPAFISRPDRWVSWWLGAVPKGLALIRKYQPRAIWSTYPIATAHVAARTLHLLTGVPWVADFRDPMAQDGYPPDRKTWLCFKRIEEQTLRAAAASIFVTRGAANVYRERYPEVSTKNVAVIENGYEEESFAGIEESARLAGPIHPQAFTLLHSGIVYPSERDPTQFFKALRAMLDQSSLRSNELRVRLRASENEAQLQKMIRSLGIETVVELAPPIPYRQALIEMVRADGLLVLQAGNCNQQIPAKLYEYLRCRRPILALTDPAGDTAELLERVGVDSIARLDSAEDIARQLRRFLDAAVRGTAPMPDQTYTRGASRQERTRELADILNGI